MFHALNITNQLDKYPIQTQLALGKTFNFQAFSRLKYISAIYKVQVYCPVKCRFLVNSLEVLVAFHARGSAVSNIGVKWTPCAHRESTETASKTRTALFS